MNEVALSGVVRIEELVDHVIKEVVIGKTQTGASQVVVLTKSGDALIVTADEKGIEVGIAGLAKVDHFDNVMDAPTTTQ